jgi:hypothetical protein
MLNTNTFIAHIRALIAQDDVKTAIQQLSDLLKNSPLLDVAVQQSARYNNVMKEIRLGLVDYEAANITQNQIRFGVLELLREMEDSLGLASSHTDTQAALRSEVERAISIVGSKNVVVDSTITAGGDVHIGDNNTTTVNNEGLTVKNQFNGGIFNNPTFE